MSQDLMNYEQMTQLALRGVVRDAIRRVIREDGLPGAHHFYITFLTRYPGAEIDEGPYHAITRFHDPSVGFALQFDPPKEMEPAAPEIAKIKPAKAPKPKAAKAKKADKEAAPVESKKAEESADKVVSLDAFRKK